MSYILAINPGSTSTKIALFASYELHLKENFAHGSDEVSKFDHVIAQKEYRKNIILGWLKNHGIAKGDLAAVVGRGGLLRSIPSGCYKVDSLMLEDMNGCIRGEHASNLGAIIADEIAKEYGVCAYIVDPVSVDEFEPLARISGIPQLERKSMVHALNCRAMAFKYATEYANGKSLEDLNLIIAHLGGGISVVPMKRGKMVDANNANEMGPFSSERAGGLPVGDFVNICFSGAYSKAEVKNMIRGKGGLAGYLGTNDIKAVEEKGDPEELKFLEAMAYQIAKEIGGAAAVLEGKADAILLTGGAAYSKIITKKIKEMTSFIADVVVLAGEDELSALSSGVARVLEGAEEAKNYTQESRRYEESRKNSQ
ncbi:MAG: butyrate kinase [Bacillota bacterium]|nr:butyrate kinase [Bacillota bacterium]